MKPVVDEKIIIIITTHRNISLLQINRRTMNIPRKTTIPRAKLERRARNLPAMNRMPKLRDNKSTVSGSRRMIYLIINSSADQCLGKKQSLTVTSSYDVA